MGCMNASQCILLTCVGLLACVHTAFSTDGKAGQVWTYNNVDVVASGGAAEFAVSTLELNRGGTCRMTLVTAGGKTASSGTWKLKKDGESLTFDIVLDDGSRCALMTKVGGKEGILTKNGEIVAVFKRKS
jgi:hypothetical protein